MRNLVIALVLIILIAGCSRTGTPLAPGLTTEGDHSAMANPAPYVWGLWDIEYDVQTGELSIIPLRSADRTWNVTMFLQPPAGNPADIGIQILDASNLISQGRIDVRVTLHHPFLSPKLRGFDVRGVVIGSGSITDSYNPDIIYAGENDLRLLNADGYTRWMNAPEFTVPGILGYTPGVMGSQNFTPTATINGYKYFADDIEFEQTVYDFYAETLGHVAMRGSMNPGSFLTRDYFLQFPTSPLQVKFQYAIIANWEKATSGGSTPGLPDFPNEANTFEPVAISVADSSTLYFESPTKKGGDIDIRLNIVDWWAYWDPDNLSDHISKVIITSNDIEMPGGLPAEFDFSSLDQYPTSAGNAEAVDIFIPGATPSASGEQEILIAVEMDGLDYTNPFGIPNGADTDPLTAYFRHTLNVADDYNDPPTIVSGVDGDSSVFIIDVATYTVDAIDDDSPTLTYEWIIKDSLTEEILYGPSAGDGAGEWEIDWGEANLPGQVKIYCSVSDGVNFTDATPLTVNVNDVIFHADLNDDVTGDNAGWSEVEQQGVDSWTTGVDDDNVLQGFGYKFGMFNTLYLHDSASILMTPEIPLPAGVDRAIAIVMHSYQFEYYAPLEVGFDGGNFKVTQAPATPTYDDPEMEIIAGRDYEGWLFDTAISDQMVYFSDLYPDELQISAYEVPSGFLGSNIYLGFACATDFQTYGDNHGWLIDNVQVRALPPGANAPPFPAAPVTGDTLVPMLSDFPGTYEIMAYDLEADPIDFAWTIRDPDTGDIVWGPVIISGDTTITIDWTEVGVPGDYEVHVSLYDGQHPGIPAVPLAVTVQEVVFHADFSDTTTGNNAGWTAMLESGATQWTTDVGSDNQLHGFGYKWGDFNESYEANSQGILVSPTISVPSGISRASLYVRYDFAYVATLDGGNFKVTLFPTTPTFATTAEKIDGGVPYDVELTGTVMDGQDAFGIGIINTNGMVSRMDLSNTQFGKNIYFGAAAASGTVSLNFRGWLIDDVVLAITP